MTLITLRDGRQVQVETTLSPGIVQRFRKARAQSGKVEVDHLRQVQSLLNDWKAVPADWKDAA